MYNSKKIKELENKINILEKENIELKNKQDEIVFTKDNPGKYEIGQESDDIIILEKRISDNSFLKYLNYQSFVAATRLLILGKHFVSKKHINLMTSMISEKYWEYRIFNKKTKKEYWVKEISVTAYMQQSK